MNARKFLNFTFLTCFSALGLTQTTSAADTFVNGMPVPDPRTNTFVGGAFAHQTLGLRIEEFVLPPGFDAAYLVVQQTGDQVAQVQFTLDPQDPWMGQAMMRVYPNETGRASVSTSKQEGQTLSSSPVFTVSYSQYYTSDLEEPEWSVEPILRFWLYTESSESYELAYEAACSKERCWQVIADKVEAKTKLSGPHI